MANIYEVSFVEKLFDEMARSYEAVNYISSFGFSKRWRRQFVRNAGIAPGMVVLDLMCGMGECWDAVRPALAVSGRLVAVDISNGMLKGARRRRAVLSELDITLLKQDALSSSLESESADCVICAFGVKTLSDEQKEVLAAEINRVLKPGGTFSLVEVSVPSGWIFKQFYMFYMKTVIPLIGRILLGNPDNYRMLGVYTEKFGDCRAFRDILGQYGFETTYHDYFFGCASGVSGKKV